MRSFYQNIMAQESENTYTAASDDMVSTTFPPETTEMTATEKGEECIWSAKGANESCKSISTSMALGV